MRKYFYTFCFFLFSMSGLVQAQEPCSDTPNTGIPEAEDTLVCSGDSVFLHLEGLTSTGLMFQWQSSPDGTTWTGIGGAIDSAYSGPVMDDTWFRCVVTCVSSGESVESPEIFIQVSTAAPSGGSISYTVSGDTYFFSVTGMSGTAYAYAWNFDDGGTSGQSNPAHTYTTSGSYDVWVVVSNGCGSDTLEQSISVLTGVNENNAASAFVQLYPNPATHGFNLVSEKLRQADRIVISDASGRIYWTQSSPVNLPIYIPVQNLHLVRGTYLVTLISGEDRAHLRLQVK